MKNIKVLVVDDIEANRVSLQYLIHEYLNEVDLLLASSGEEALKITYKDNIDIIILDIQMPGLDGFDTAKYLKSNPRTKQIPIIFLTAAFKEEEFKQKGFEIGAIDYLTKPIENLQFINKLKLYIEVIIKTKQLEAVNDNLYDTLKKEIELKEQIQKQQLELIEQTKMAALGEMIGNIAHQWRQPLSILSTCASGMQLNLELGLANEKDMIFNIKTIMKNIEDLSKTIDTFRDLTYKDKLDKFNLSEIIHKCIETKKYIFDNHKINIVTNLNDNIILVNLPNSLIQALINIMRNSKEAFNNFQSKKYIFINTILEKEHVIIKIKDNAGGIKTEILNKIFEPYFTTKQQLNGVGLGLNIVYKLINDSLLGKVKVRNSRYSYNNTSHEGAEFTITVPLSL